MRNSIANPINKSAWQQLRQSLRPAARNAASFKDVGQPDKSFEVKIKRQKRKSLALHILPDATVEVRAPKWVSIREINHFVEERSDWVLERRAAILIKLQLTPGFTEGERHFFMGENYPLLIAKASRAAVQLDNNVLLVNVREVDNVGQIEKALEKWYRRQATVIYEERMFACFEVFPDWFQDKYPMPAITIRKMKRRWGSCSKQGDVTLNLSLIKMPVECIDYVIAHELVHLEFFHHGKEFYRLLAEVMPDWRERELLIEQLG